MDNDSFETTRAGCCGGALWCFCSEFRFQNDTPLREKRDILSDSILATSNVAQILKKRVFVNLSPTPEFQLADTADFERVQLIAKFFGEAFPHLILFLLLENVILHLRKLPTYRLNDGITSLSNGLFQECTRLVSRGAESYLYVFVYENFHFIDLPWNYAITWYAAVIVVDFCYYWFHRASHEVHILWAQHQVHHSSEEFNLAVGLRQSFLQGLCGSIFYLPLAFVVPPIHFLSHHQLNLLYQFWIHTKAIKSLGPLEYIFNTPNHHRVHHGSNLYCLDKNFGGIFIIWDRIFGTFGEEDKDEEIIYGLVFNQPSFNPLHLQTFYNRYVHERFTQMKTWKDKFAAVFYGPSWQPGRPRLGVEEDKFKVTCRDIYDVKLPLWCNLYLMVHFGFVVYGYQELAGRHMGMNPISVFGFISYIIASLTIIGMLFDNTQKACKLELLRCIILTLGMQYIEIPDVSHTMIRNSTIFFGLSGIFWSLQCLQILKINSKSKIT